MKLAALFSGGKDSTFSIYQTIQQGNTVPCLVTISPQSAQSMLLHHQNISISKLQADSMKIPQMYLPCNSLDTSDEINLLCDILLCAKQRYDIQGLVHGGICSNFQKNNFDLVCKKLDLHLISPIWDLPPKQYLYDLLAANFEFIITSVTCDGLDDSWLGKKITSQDVIILDKLSKKHGFNLNFEGGEAETLVTNCPLFSHELVITKSTKIWDGYRGRLEIEATIPD